MRPTTVQEAADLLKGFEQPVRPVGGGTKPWLPDRGEAVLETGGLDRILEHNVGDFTAVLEAGVPFADAQQAFAEHGQRLAWDPPDRGRTRPRSAGSSPPPIPARCATATAACAIWSSA